MNVIDTPGGLVREISAQDLQQARNDAQSSRRSLVQVLEQKLSLQPWELVACLGRMFHYPVLAMEDLKACVPLFTIIPYTEAVDRNAVALRTDDDALIIALADPFDATLEAWLSERITEPYELAVVH